MTVIFQAYQNELNTYRQFVEEEHDDEDRYAPSRDARKWLCDEMIKMTSLYELLLKELPIRMELVNRPIEIEQQVVPSSSTEDQAQLEDKEVMSETEATGVQDSSDPREEISMDIDPKDTAIMKQDVPMDTDAMKTLPVQLRVPKVSETTGIALKGIWVFDIVIFESAVSKQGP